MYEAGSNQAGGWLAKLDLEIVRRNGKTVVSRSRQSGPLTYQKPFYPEQGVCHVYLLHPPSGLVSTDRMQLGVTIGSGAEFLLTTPGAAKVYRSTGGTARIEQTFNVAQDSSLEWLPQETIYYPGARAAVSTAVFLEGQARFIGWDIHCFGLPARGEGFGTGRAAVKLTVFRDGMPLVVDSLRLEPEKAAFQAAVLRNRPVNGMLIATGADETMLDRLRRDLPEASAGTTAITLFDDVAVVRYLGDSTAEAKTLFSAAWQLVRPQLLGRQASLPRIWAT